MAATAPRVSESEDRSLEIYFREIRRVSLLTRAEEVALARRARRGDRDALDGLVGANLRFVVSVARGFAGRGLPLADLVNEGNLGLFKAAERFDERRGHRFISYAIWWIRQAILQALTEQPRVVRIPLNRAGKALRIDRASRSLVQQLGREPTDGEIARAMKLTEDDVALHKRISQRAVSLNAPSGEGNEGTLGELLPDSDAAPTDEEVIRRDLERHVRHALDVLDPRERRIVRQYFGIDSGDGSTLESIGQEMGLTRERVRQLKERAMGKIRASSEGEALRSYTVA